MQGGDILQGGHPEIDILTMRRYTDRPRPFYDRGELDELRLGIRNSGNDVLDEVWLGTSAVLESILYTWQNAYSSEYAMRNLATSAYTTDQILWKVALCRVRQ